MNMAEDQVDNTVVEDSGSSFGEVAERETNDDAVLVEDKLKAANAEESKDETAETEEGKSTESEESKDETGEAKPELTEKGTKKDPNPLSAAHQELANERKVRGQMEKVLGSPELLKRFMKEQYGIDPEAPVKETATEVTTPELKEYKPDDFENLDDVANVVNGLQKNFADSKKSYEDKIEELTKQVNGLVDGGKRQEIANKVGNDIATLQKEKELDPNSSEYIPGLEEKIAEQYHKLDYDSDAKAYRGNTSISEVGQILLEVARNARKAGSVKAQTIVKDKSQGKIRSGGSVDDTPNTDKLSPEDSIAYGISKMFK